MSSLEGKWVWIWNWPRADGGDATAVAQRLREAGCVGALVKAHDGPHWQTGAFDQGRPWREICRSLKANGIRCGGWGYFYGQDIDGEAQRAVETIQYGEADLYVMDVEGEFKGRPTEAEAICQAIRQAVGNDYPLFYSSFAIARYHRAFPYEAFNRHCAGALPQVYYNAFGWPPEQALQWMYEDYAALGLAPDRIFPVAGAYQEGQVAHPSAESLAQFSDMARQRGSRGISFWSYEHMDDATWSAIAAITHGEPVDTPAKALTYRRLHLANDAFWDSAMMAVPEPTKLDLRGHFGLPVGAKYVDLLVGVRSSRRGGYIAFYDPPGNWDHLVAHISAHYRNEVNLQQAQVQMTEDGAIYWRVQPADSGPLNVYVRVVGMYA